MFRTSLRRIPRLSRAVATTASPHPHQQHPRFRFRYVVLPLVAGGGIALALQRASADADATGIASVPTKDLLRSYFVYTACGIPAVIDAAPTLLRVLTTSPIPGVKPITEAIIRRTFFAQFVAGEDLPETLVQVSVLNNRGIGGLLNYAAEAEPGDGEVIDRKAVHRMNLAQDHLAIDALGEYEAQLARTGGQTGSSQFAVKVVSGDLYSPRITTDPQSGLIDYSVLERASTTITRLRPLSSSDVPAAQLNDVAFPGIPQTSDAAVIAPAEHTTAASVSPTLGSIEPLGLLATDASVTDSDMVALHQLWVDMREMSAKARDKGVKLLIDAEYACTQPALDALTLLLSREFNRPVPGKPFAGPTIFGTYQSYLRRAPYILDAAIADADKHGYALGVKLVRGAYFVSERKKWASEGRGQDPIWEDKPTTDKAYNESLSKVFSVLSRQLSSPNPELALSVVFGTHNAESVERFLSELKSSGLAESSNGALRLRGDARGKVFIAQLYGMRDDLTDKVAESLDSGGLPVALKYIAYGKLDEVLPFLARRAIENKAVMAGEGGAKIERERVTKELVRRLTGARPAKVESVPVVA